MENMKISKTYASAIFKMAQDNDQIFPVLEMLEVLLKRIKQDDDFKQFLIYPIISVSDKKNIINSIYCDIKDMPIDILDYLLDKKRLHDIENIRNEYIKIYYEFHNQLIVKAIFAKKISKEQKDNLEKKLEKMKNKKILLNIDIDKNIIAGGIIKIGDEVIDGSLKSQIKKFKNMF